MKTSSPIQSPSQKVGLYDFVTLRILDETIPFDEREMHLQLVPNHEADIYAGKISVETPVGQAVLKRKMGDMVKANTQPQPRLMQIISVEKRPRD